MTPMTEHDIDTSVIADRVILEEQITKALPGLRKDQRTVIFMDYNNFEYTLKDLGVTISMKELKAIFAARCNLLDSRIYWAFDHKNTGLMERLAALQMEGFTVIHKDLVTNHLGVRKGNMDTELALDVGDIPDNVEHIVLFSGDQDFLPLIKKMRHKFKQVSVCSTRELSPPVIRHEVIQAASNFYDIISLLPKIRTDDTVKAAGHEQ